MTWNGVTTPLGLFVLFFIGVLHAQDPNDPNVAIPPDKDPCANGITFSITFPEADLSSTPPENVRRISDLTTYYVTIEQEKADKNPRYPYTEYFSQPAKNTVGNYYYITNLKAIDRDGPTVAVTDDTKILQYIIVCTPVNGGASAPTIYSVLKIQIVDLNDNPPVFSAPVYRTTVNELTPAGTTIYRDFSVTDLDEGANKPNHYTLEDSPGAKFSGIGKFYLPVTGDSIVAVKGNLSFEQMYRDSGNDVSLCYYNMTVVASDGGNPPQSARVTFIIQISDGDNQGPEFLYPSCIPSTEKYGKACIRAKYLSSLQPGTLQTLTSFTPDPANASDPYAKVNIIAQDRDTLNSQINFTIARTEPTGFDQYFSVVSQPYDNIKKYQCNIAYNPLSGTGLDRNTVPSLDLIIEAVENTFNQRREVATVTFTLAQTSNSNPVITPSTATGYINENSPDGTFVVSTNTSTRTILKLAFSDPDVSRSDPQPNWTISVTPSTPFTVTPDGYVQLTSDVLDYEVQKTYTFTVTITNPAQSGSGSAVVTVNVLDLNDNSPVFTSNYSRRITEGNYLQPKLLLSVSAPDLDFGPVTYSKISVSPAGNEGKFSVSKTGEVTYQGDMQANSVFVVTARASDNGSPQRSTDTAIIVSVNPVGNRSPSFAANSSTIYVSEDVPFNSSLFLLQAFDPDTNTSSLIYSITSETPSSVPVFFTVLGNMLMSARTFDREIISAYTVGVRVRDPQNNTADATVNVQILDVNDNSPVFIQVPYIFSIQENQQGGSVVGNVTATDADAPNTPNSAVTYSIVPVLNAAQFSINPTSGQITSNEVFDYEKKKSYEIVVRASDSGNSQRVSDIVVTINILDMPDSFPLFESLDAEASVSENATVNQFVLRLPVSDADTTPNIVLIITNPDITPLPFRVEKDGNYANIIVNGFLDFETKSVYRFTVTTEDGQRSVNAPFTAVYVTVRVLTSNSNPVITPSTATGYMNENSPEGTFVVLTNTSPRTILKLAFSDPDVPSCYQQPLWVIAVTPPSPFTVTSDGYVQLTSDELDYELQNTYTFTVTITNPGQSGSGSAVVTVNVLDLNDNSPVFTSNYNRRITERNYSQPEPLMFVLATDLDFGPVTYSKISVSPAGNEGKFSVSNAGEVTYQGDIKANSVFVVTVRASDNGFPQRSTDTAIIVFVDPVGNGSPSFAVNSSNIFVSEDVPLNSPLFLLQARDPDTDASSLIYSITSETPSSFPSYFTVLGNMLKNSRTFDREIISAYTVGIRVRDPQGNTAEATVNVQILDVNDNSPVFSQSSYIFISYNLLIGATVGIVQATDADAANTPNSAVTYSIVPVLNAAQFSINPTTGQLTSKAMIDHEKKDPYQILVRASDSGNCPLFSEIVVTVNVQDKQDSFLLFQFTHRETLVSERATLNQVIFRLPISNADSAPNSTLIITNPDIIPLPFRVEKDGSYANIIVNGALNKYIKSVYRFTVTTEGQQSGNLPFTAVYVTVSVGD